MSEESQNNAGGNEGGANGADSRPQWMASLPDAYKQHEGFAQFKEPSEAWAKFDTLLKAEGSMVTIPGEGAKPEEVAAFYSKLGRPENVDGYTITKPADLPEGVPYDPAIEAEFKKFAHAQNLTAAQAESLYGWYYGLVKNGHASEQARLEKAQGEAIDKLKTDWGAKFDGNKEIAIRAFKTFGNEETAALLDKQVDGVKLGDHPAFIKWFHSIGTKIMDDKATFGNDGGAGGDTVEAQERKRAEQMFPSMTKK